MAELKQFVYAGSNYEYADYLHRNRLDRSRHTHVKYPDQDLRGIARGTRIIIVPGAERRQDYAQLCDIANQRNFKLEYSR